MTTKTAMPPLTPEAWMKKNRAIMRRLEAYADLSAAEVDAAIKTIPGVDQATTDAEVNAIVTAFVETELAALAAAAEAAAEMETGTDQQITIKNTPVTSSARQTVASMAPTGSNTPALANLAKLARFTGQNLPSSVRFPVIQWLNGKKDMQTARYRNMPPEGFNSGAANITYLEVFGGFAFKQASGSDFPLGKIVQYRFQGAQEDEFLYDINQGGTVYVSVIAWRHDWKYKDEATGRLVPSLDYVKGREVKAWGRFWLVFKGAEAWHAKHGPMMLSVYGSAMWRFKDILDKTRTRMLNEAEKLIGARPPDYAFYLPIRPGEPTTVGKEGKQSIITPPEVDLTGLPENPADALSLLMLSDDMLTLCSTYWDELSRLATEPLAAQVEAINAWDNANTPADDAFVGNNDSTEVRVGMKAPGRPNGPGSAPTKTVPF